MHVVVCAKISNDHDDVKHFLVVFYGALTMLMANISYCYVIIWFTGIILVFMSPQFAVSDFYFEAELPTRKDGCKD